MLSVVAGLDAAWPCHRRFKVTESECLRKAFDQNLPAVSLVATTHKSEPVHITCAATKLEIYSDHNINMSRETTALVVSKPDGTFSYETIKLGKLKPDEALVEIHASGICHTDLSCASGKLPAPMPSVFGHEGKSLRFD